MKKNSLFPLFFRYSTSGILSFLFELLLLWLCFYVLSLPYYISVPLAFVIATTLQYTICHWWVFSQSGRAVRFEYAYFMTILFSGMLWALVLVALFVQFFGLELLLARILAGIFTGLWDFYLNARFNFRAHAFLRKQ